MDLTFKTEKKKTGIEYLRFLPKDMRSTGGLSIILNVLGFIFAFVFYIGAQKEIPLFYSLPADQQLIRKEFIFILPIFATLMNIVHLWIAYFEKEINYNVLKMFVQITLLLQILVLAILLRIIIIVS